MAFVSRASASASRTASTPSGSAVPVESEVRCRAGHDASSVSCRGPAVGPRGGAGVGQLALDHGVVGGLLTGALSLVRAGELLGRRAAGEPRGHGGHDHHGGRDAEHQDEAGVERVGDQGREEVLAVSVETLSAGSV